ncbi:MAG: hypothetical protein ACTSQE_13555 [Candidatus Heimdallarchaeaceae archaeon]
MKIKDYIKLNFLLKSLSLVIFIICIILLSRTPSQSYLENYSIDYIEENISQLSLNANITTEGKFGIYSFSIDITVEETTEPAFAGISIRNITIEFTAFGWSVFITQIIILLYWYYSFLFIRFKRFLERIFGLIMIFCPALSFIPLFRFIKINKESIHIFHPYFNTLIEGKVVDYIAFKEIISTTLYRPEFKIYFLVVILVNMILQLLFFIVNTFRNQSMMNLLGFISETGATPSRAQLVPFLVIFSLLTIVSVSSSPIVVLLLSWAFAGPRITGVEQKTESEFRNTQLNRLKGLIKIYREIEISKASEIMNMPEDELVTFLVENVGAGTLDLTIVDDKIVAPVDLEIDDVLKSLDNAFKSWFDQEKSGTGKKK